MGFSAFRDIGQRGNLRPTLTRLRWLIWRVQLEVMYRLLDTNAFSSLGTESQTGSFKTTGNCTTHHKMLALCLQEAQSSSLWPTTCRNIQRLMAFAIANFVKLHNWFQVLSWKVDQAVTHQLDYLTEVISCQRHQNNFADHPWTIMLSF